MSLKRREGLAADQHRLAELVVERREVERVDVAVLGPTLVPAGRSSPRRSRLAVEGALDP